MVGPPTSPKRTVYVDLTLTRSKVNVKVTGLLNFRQLAKPCVLAAMTPAPLRGFLVYCMFVRTMRLLLCVRLIERPLYADTAFFCRRSTFSESLWLNVLIYFFRYYISRET